MPDSSSSDNNHASGRGQSVAADPSLSASPPSASRSPSHPSTATATATAAVSATPRTRSARFDFPRASQPEIVRAYQKDEYYRELFTSHLTDVARGLLGTRTLHAHLDTIALIGSLTYFALSSLGGATQTLGEEYVNAIMVQHRRRKPTSSAAGRVVRARRRTAFILLHVLTPFLLTRLYTALRRFTARKHAADEASEQRARLRARALGQTAAPPAPGGPRGLWRRLVATAARRLPSMETIRAQDGWLAYAGAAHLMLFYLGGRYYSVAQRLAGVQYISSIPQRLGTKPPSYEVLGVLLGIQLVVKLSLSLHSYLTTPAPTSSHSTPPPASTHTITIDQTSYTHTTSPASLLARPPSTTAVPLHYITPLHPPAPHLLPRLATEPDQARHLALAKARAEQAEEVARSILRCTLCMDARRPERGTSAITECGHLFCWDCILGWAREKPECPLCRQSLNVSRILPVYNF